MMHIIRRNAHHIPFWGFLGIMLVILALAYAEYDPGPHRLEVDGVTCITYGDNIDCNWTEHNRREFWGERLRRPDLKDKIDD